MRVSTQEQTTDNQAVELRAFAARAGHQVVAEFLDVELAYKSLYDAWLDSGIPMLRDIMLSVLASFARNERETLIARRKAGPERAKAKGKVLGRPRLLGVKGHVGDLQNIQRLHRSGWSQRKIAESLKLSKGTLQRALIHAGNIKKPTCYGR